MHDSLRELHTQTKASREYLRILYPANLENESGVDDCLRSLMSTKDPVSTNKVEEAFHLGKEPGAATNVDMKSASMAMIRP